MRWLFCFVACVFTSCNSEVVYDIYAKDGYLYAATDRGGYFSADMVSWQPIKWGIFNPKIRGFVSPHDKKEIYGWSDTVVFVATLSSSYWQECSFNRALINTVALDSKGSLYIGGFGEPGGLWISHDKKNWEIIEQTKGAQITVIAIQDNNVWAGTNDGILFFKENTSFNTITTWQKLQTPLKQIRCIVVGDDNTVLIGGKGGVYVKKIGSLNLESLNTGLLTHDIRHIIKIGAYYYAGLKVAGVYRFENGRWHRYTANLANTNVNKLAFYNGALFAATDKGIYKTDVKYLFWKKVAF